MRPHRRPAVILGLVLAAPVAAETADLAAGRKPAPVAVALGGAWFDFNRRQDAAAEGRIELRRRPVDSPFRPFVTTSGTSDRSVFVGAGLGYDVVVGERLVLTPSLAPGLYRKGDGKDLGSALQFRTQLEAAYRFPSGPRLGLAVSHTSNAGFAYRNPGQESLTLMIEVPLSKPARHRAARAGARLDRGPARPGEGRRPPGPERLGWW